MGVGILVRQGRRAVLIALAGFMSGLALAALVMLVLASAARADHSVVEHVSQGATGGNGAFSASLRWASTDGSVVLFDTREQLAPADTDTESDAYRRAGGVTELATAGPASTGPNYPNLTGMTPDGAAVFFYTRDALVAGDTDSIDDAYMYRAATTTLLSPGPSACPGSQSHPFAWSDDGTKVFIQSTDRLAAADTDCNSDVYEYSAGTLTLVQPGPGSNFLVDVSGDGARVFFTTSDALVPGDTDAASDLYMREGAALTLVSIGAAGGNGAFNVLADWVSPAGDVTYFRTWDQLAVEDTDSALDIYAWDEGAVTLVSIGAVGGNDGTEPVPHVPSPDFSHMFFSTTEQLVADDTDAQSDIYDYSGGTTMLVSTGLAGGNGAFDPIFLQHGVSKDGGKVYFLTREKLVASDNNGLFDIYERSVGTTTLPFVGPSGASLQDAYLQGMSADGSRVFFSTSQRLVPADTDNAVDLYERAGSVTTLVSLGPTGGNGGLNVVTTCCPPGMVSDDGSRVFFYTSESLVSSDTDASQDIYSASVGPPAGYPRPKGATPLRVSLVPAFQLCSSPNRTHGPALAFGSCNPPAPESTRLTVGSPDSNGQPAVAEGFAKYEVLVGNPATTSDEADVAIQARITDVRVQGTLADYTGTLAVVSTVRITDKNNGTGPEPATLTDLDLRAFMTCAATAGSAGATCSLNTTFDAIAPGTVTEARRTVWALDRVRVFDGGADNNAGTQPNTVFATQGIFVP